MAQTERPTVTLRDVTLIFRNFAGEEKKFNAEGQRNFAILLDELTANDLLSNGWAVKPLQRKSDEDDQMYFLKVSVSYKTRPPQAWLISSGGRSLLGEGLISIFDTLEFSKVDLVLSGYNWEVNGNSGIKAYLGSIYATMYQDELAIEYAHVPQIGVAGEVETVPEIEAGSRLAYDYDGEVVEATH